MRITDQGLVNYVVKFMKKQRKPATKGGTLHCTNIAPDGSRCAIACCFTKPSAEKFPNVELREWLVSHGASRDVVEKLLTAHDDAAHNKGDFFSAFRSKLTFLLEGTGLKIPC